jgi:biotin carboxyl carrier protein
VSEKIYQFPSAHTENVERQGIETENSRLQKISQREFKLLQTNNLKARTFWISHRGTKRIVSWPGGCLELDAIDPLEAGAASSGGKLKPLKVTMPGKVLAIKVKEGDRIEPGQTIAIVEAMKMENVLLATASAVVEKIHVKVGDRLESGTVIVSFCAS